MVDTVTTVDTLRRNIASQVATAVSGLNCYPYLPGSVEAPAFMLLPSLLDGTDQTMGQNSLAEHSFEALLIVSMAGSFETPQQQLAILTDRSGQSSILRAMFADRTFGGAAISFFADGWSREDIEPYGDIEYLGQRLTFRVWVA